MTKQDLGAFGLGNSMTLNDWDNSDPNSLVADATTLEGSVTNGILKVASDPVKLNLKNIDAFANGTGGKAPSLSSDAGHGTYDDGNKNSKHKYPNS